MSDFVAKPVNPDALYLALLKWLPATSSPPQSELFAPGNGEITTPAPAVLPQDPAAWQRRLAGIPGLDVEQGLALVRGKADMYTRLLALFADTEAQNATLLSAALAAHDDEMLEKLSHALKGSAGNIGATAVAEAALALNTALRQKAAHELVESASNRLIAELGLLMQGIGKALNLPGAGPQIGGRENPPG